MIFHIANHVVPECLRLRTFACFLGMIAGLCGTAAFAQTMTANAASQGNAGRQIFEAICAGCHGLDAKGGERGPDIATRQQVVQLSDEKLMEILRGGRPAAGMPPFEYLGSAKLTDVLNYLRTLQGKGSTAGVTGNPANGKALFFGAARCSECHMVQGAGGFIGRDLSNYGAMLSAAEIRANIVKPGDSKSN